MKAKEYLLQIRIFEKRIHQKELELRVAETSDLKGIDYSKDRVQISHSDSTPYSMILAAEISDEIDRYKMLRYQIVNQIQTLGDSRYEQVLYDRFVTNRSLKQIAMTIPCAESTVYRWYNEALSRFQDKYLNGGTNAAESILRSENGSK